MLSTKTIIITKLIQVKSLLKSDKKQSVLFYTLDISSSKSNVQVLTTLQRLYSSKIIKINKLNLNKSDMRLKNYSHYELVKAHTFTTDFIYVKLSSQIANKMADKIFNNTMIVVYTQSGYTKFYLEVHVYIGNMSKTVVYDIEDNMTIVENVASGKAYRYKATVVGDNGKKERGIYFQDITNGDNRFDTIDYALNGAATTAFEEYKKLVDGGLDADSRESREYLGKKLVQFGKILTPSMHLGDLKNVAIYRGKFFAHTDAWYMQPCFVEAATKYELAIKTGNMETVLEAKEALEKAKELAMASKTKETIMDGWGIISAEALARLLSNRYGMTVTVNAVLGMILQGRALPSKPCLEALRKNTICVVIDGLEEIIEFNKKNIKAAIAIAKTPEEIASLTKDLSREVIETTDGSDPRQCELIIDSNCLKNEFDLSINPSIEFHYIASKNNNNPAHLSSQLAMGFLVACKKLLDEGVTSVNGTSIADGGDSVIADLLGNSVSEKVNNTVFSKHTQVMSIENIKSDLQNHYSTNIINAYAPYFKFKDKGIYLEVVKQLVNGVVNSLEKFQCDLPGSSKYLMPDITYIITGGRVSSLIEFGQVICNDERLQKSLMIKYPKNGMEEHYCVTNILCAVKGKVDELVCNKTITANMGLALVDRINNIDSHAVILFCESLVQHIASGGDADGDAGTFLYFTEAEKLSPVEKSTNDLIEVMRLAGEKATIIVR